MTVPEPAPQSPLRRDRSLDSLASLLQDQGDLPVARPLPEHPHTGNRASFSPDGLQILTASADGTAGVWDVISGKEIILLKAHEGVVYCASFSADGGRILTGGEDGTARVWDAKRGKEIALFKAHEAAVYDASFSVDGRRIVTTSADGTARVWDVSRTELLVCEPAFVLAAALARGIGWRTDSERNDLLMRDAEDDLYAGALRGHRHSIRDRLGGAIPHRGIDLRLRGQRKWPGDGISGYPTQKLPRLGKLRHFTCLAFDPLVGGGLNISNIFD